MSGLVEVRRHGSVCVVALRREAKLNALSTELERALGDALGEIGDSRAVVITGSERAFSAGADLTELSDRSPEDVMAYYRDTGRVYERHNPKHGGVFFMAPDNWHHLEGTYPAAGRFRVYVYDDFSKPLGRDQARKVRGRVVTKEAFDPKTGTTRELASTPLVLARNGAFLEARIEQLPLPAKLTAKITFSPDNKESRFDFAFPAYSRDIPTAAVTTSAAPVAPIAPVAPVAPIAPVAPSSLLTDLKAQRAEIESLLQTGSVGGVYVPALRAKDLALEIQATQSPATQDAIEASVKQIVLTAYQLDNYGDLGDAEKAREAFRGMGVAIAQLESLISEPTR